MIKIKTHKAEQSPDLNEKLDWLQLARTENVGPITFYKFIDFYGSAAKALEALPDLARRGGRKKPLQVPPRAVIEREYERIRKMGGAIVTAHEDTYPLALSATEDAPPVMTVMGDVSLMNKPCLAIVGARNASLNGRRFAESLARDLGEAGQMITSGLARGIDTAAHEGALETGTIAVVAGGIDIVYPSENQALYERICEQGLVIAESPLGTAPRARDFPRRNRIVSGLSQGVVVVEATERSGSLITARLAGEQGRDVYAIPGHPFDPRAAGPNRLIRDGATLVRGATDILEGIRNFSGGLFDAGSSRFAPPFPALADIPKGIIPEEARPAHSDPQTGDEARDIILSSLSYTPCEIDDLARRARIGISLMHTVLLELELAGRIQRIPGNKILLLSPPD